MTIITRGYGSAGGELKLIRPKLPLAGTIKPVEVKGTVKPVKLSGKLKLRED